MIITLVFVAFVDFAADFKLLLWMILLNNFFCATQDVAIDSLAVSTLQRDERATGNGLMVGGQYLGIGLGGGGALFVSGFRGFNASLIYIRLLMLFQRLQPRSSRPAWRYRTLPSALAIIGKEPSRSG